MFIIHITDLTNVYLYTKQNLVPKNHKNNYLFALSCNFNSSIICFIVAVVRRQNISLCSRNKELFMISEKRVYISLFSEK